MRTTLVVLVVALALVGTSIGRTLTRPGSDSVSARLAEWGRDHHLGSTVDWLEKRQYTPPKIAGTPEADSPLVAGPTLITTSVEPPPVIAGPAVPTAIVPPASPPLATEGEWQPLTSANGLTIMAAAYVRPDAVHTSYTAGLVWWNPTAIKGALHPGTLDPGGTWSEATSLPTDQRTNVLAAFNGGFRLDASKGGYYADGKEARPLRDGAASMVFFKDGTMTVGQWGRDVGMTDDIASVRQNLALLVDGGALVPGVASNVGDAWGATIGNAKYVWRSGLGVREDGGMVYVAGDRLTAESLGDLLVRAGAVRGMELDINPYWTSFVLYAGPDSKNLLPAMENSPRRYDSPSSRDFVSLSLR